MSHHMGYLLRAGLGGMAVALVLSCKNVDEPLAPAAIDGDWRYTETLDDQLDQLTCADTGTYTFEQSGSKFTGHYTQTGICHNGSTKFVNAGVGQVTDGAVTDVHVQFTAGAICTYGGRLSAAHDAVSAGTGICDYVDSATSHHYSVQVKWEMSRP
ncbi:MAG TPA: hypothetical protein VFD85_13505 [Gemmatimonadales bacterium]|nr:hypothetical protein [Gemmatimonadales bacterium]